MAIILEGNGTITGVSTLTTPLDDIQFDSIKITGIATAGTFQAGTGVSMASPRSQTLSFYTNNTEWLSIDDAGRVGIGTTNAQIAADTNNAKVVNAGIITANQYYGNQLTAAGSRVTGVGTFENGLNITGNITNGLNVSAGLVTFTDTGTSQYVLDVYNPTAGSSGARVRAGNNDGQYSFLVENGAGTNLFEVLAGGGGARLRSGSLYILDKIIHYDDTNTAIRFPSTDTITAETAGNEAVRITSGGKVGINSDSPGQLFEVSNGNIRIHANTDPALYLQSKVTTTGTPKILFGDPDSFQRASINYDLSGDNALIFKFGGAGNNIERLRVKGSNGYIGIATDAPEYTVDAHVGSGLAKIVGSSSGGQLSIRTENHIGNQKGHCGIYFSNQDHSGGREKAAIFHVETHGQAHYKGDFAICLNTASGGAARVSLSDERVRFKSSGQVGIGLTDPESFNSGADDLVIQGSGSCGLTIDATSSTNSNVFFADGADGNEQYRGWVQYEHNNDAMTFGTAAGERIRIPSGGGILFNGDTAAANTLDDYEEGTHSYSLQGQGSNPSGETIDNNYNKIFYVKVGSVVHCYGELRWKFNSGGFGSGTAYITLPFTAASVSPTAAHHSCGTVQMWNVDWKNGQSGADYLICECKNNSNQMYFRRSEADTTTENTLSLGTGTFQTANSSLGTEVCFQLTYQAA